MDLYIIKEKESNKKNLVFVLEDAYKTLGNIKNISKFICEGGKVINKVKIDNLKRVCFVDSDSITGKVVIDEWLNTIIRKSWSILRVN